MAPEKCFKSKCEVCGRNNLNDRMLGPLIRTNTVTANFNCVLFSPVMPDVTSIAKKAGRAEGGRAKKLGIFSFLFILFDSLPLSLTQTNTIFFK